MLLPMPDDNFMYFPDDNFMYFLDDDNDVPISLPNGAVIGMWIGFIIICIALVIWIIVSIL